MQTQNQNKPYIKYIDIDTQIRESGSAFFKKIPNWVISILRKIIRQKEINYYLNKYEGYEGIDFLNAMLTDFNIDLQLQGEENLPETGKCLFVANHPFGVVDGLILTRIVCSKYKDFKSIGNDAFLLVPNLKPHIINVNVYGKSSREEILKLNEIYDSDMPITHFPAGEVSRIYHGKISDCDWQKSFIGKSFSCKRDIVPIHFSGRNSVLFYSIFILRRMFGIKLNIELMLLPREMLKKRNKTIRVKILKPIPWQIMEKVQQHSMAQKVKNYLYEERNIF